MKIFSVNIKMYMVKVSYEQKPFRREVMRTYGASGQLSSQGSPWQNVPFYGYHIQPLQVNLKFSNYFPITC